LLTLLLTKISMWLTGTGQSYTDGRRLRRDLFIPLMAWMTGLFGDFARRVAPCCVTWTQGKGAVPVGMKGGRYFVTTRAPVP
jgi:hypothetical protein